MSAAKYIMTLLWILSLSARALAQQCPEGDYVCVEKPDLEMFLQLARDAKCRAETAPVASAEPISIVLDREGRVFGSGTGDKPFALRLDWCNYQLETTSQIRLMAAQRVEPDWGFRFRPKAAFGVLTRELFDGRKVRDYGDIGLMLEPFYYRWVNLNGFVSFRSVGVGLGFDITTNFGAAVLLNTLWGEWRANPVVALYFAF
jgi:hypothetical protein